jgi:hypothetical protein
MLNGVTFAAKDSVGQALAWIGDRFRGVPAPSVCEYDASLSEHELAGRDRQNYDHQEGDKENEEQDLGDLRRSRSDAGIAERARNQRDQETDECPFQKRHAPSFSAAMP